MVVAAKSVFCDGDEDNDEENDEESGAKVIVGEENMENGGVTEEIEENTKGCDENEGNRKGNMETTDVIAVEESQNTMHIEHEKQIVNDNEHLDSNTSANWSMEAHIDANSSNDMRDESDKNSAGTNNESHNY